MRTLAEIDAERIRLALRPFLGRTIDPALPVRVYRNLHGKGARRWSILQGRRVVAHAARLMLRDVTFEISAAGVARSRRLGKKVVCAFAVGRLAGSGMGLENCSDATLPARIEFDPKAGAFVCRNLTRQVLRMTSARVALFNEHGMSGAYTEHER